MQNPRTGVPGACNAGIEKTENYSPDDTPPAPGQQAPSTEKPHFGAIPTRAFFDKRLTNSDFRVLGIIAYHDRMSKNGAGCYLIEDQMARSIGIRRETVSRRLPRLVEWGYLSATPWSRNRRRKTYKIVYTTEDDLYAPGNVCDVEITQPRKYVISRTRSVTSPTSDVVDSVGKSTQQYSNISCETAFDEKSCETASNQQDLLGKQERSRQGRYLRELEAAMRAGKPLYFTETEDNLLAIIESTAPRLDNLNGWAERLLQELQDGYGDD